MSHTPTCVVRVFQSGMFSSFPCSRKATVQHNGDWYCWQHDPDRVAARRKASKEKSDKDWAAKEANWARNEACRLFFHSNDGRAIPTEKLAEMEGGFWLLTDKLKEITMCFNSARMIMDPTSMEIAGEIVDETRALLDRMGVK